MGDPVRIRDMAEQLIRLHGFVPGKASPPPWDPAPTIDREKAFGWIKRLPNASRLQETSLCLHVHLTLEEEHMHAVGEAAARVLSEA